MVAGLINPNPVVYERKERRVRTPQLDVDEYAVEPIDTLEIYDILLICQKVIEILFDKYSHPTCLVFFISTSKQCSVTDM